MFITVTENSFLRKNPDFKFRIESIPENKVTSYHPYSESFRSSFAPFVLPGVSPTYVSPRYANYNNRSSRILPIFARTNPGISELLSKAYTSLQSYTSFLPSFDFAYKHRPLSSTSQSFLRNVDSNQDIFFLHYTDTHNLNAIKKTIGKLSIFQFLDLLFCSSEEIFDSDVRGKTVLLKQFTFNKSEIGNLKSNAFCRLVNAHFISPESKCYSFMIYEADFPLDKNPVVRIVHLWVCSSATISPIHAGFEYGFRNYLINACYNQHGIVVDNDGLLTVEYKIHNNTVLLDKIDPSNIIMYNTGFMIDASFAGMSIYRPSVIDLSRIGVLSYSHSSISYANWVDNNPLLKAFAEYTVTLINSSSCASNSYDFQKRHKDISALLSNHGSVIDRLAKIMGEITEDELKVQTAMTERDVKNISWKNSTDKTFSLMAGGNFFKNAVYAR